MRRFPCRAPSPCRSALLQRGADHHPRAPPAYRVVGGSIVWIYKLFRVDRIVTEAVTLAKNEVREKTGLPVYEGAPEMTATGHIVTGPTGA